MNSAAASHHRTVANWSCRKLQLCFNILSNFVYQSAGCSSFHPLFKLLSKDLRLSCLSEDLINRQQNFLSRNRKTLTGNGPQYPRVQRTKLRT